MCCVTFLASPVFSSTSPAAIAGLHQLAVLMETLPAPSKDLVYGWIERDVPAELFASRFVKPLQDHLAYYSRMLVSQAPSAEFHMRALRLIVKILGRLHAVNESARLVDHNLFQNVRWRRQTTSLRCGVGNR